MQSQSISQASASRPGAFCKFIDSEAYESKMLAATELENLLKGSKNLRWMTDDGCHKEAVRGWTSWKTTFAVRDAQTNTVNVYEGEVKIMHIARGDVFHDITQIKNVTNDTIGQSIQMDAKSVGDITSVAQPGESVKFSLREPVERTNDLIAVHNLTKRNLLDAMSLGGLPSTSIAIVKARDGYSKYGPISIVFDRSSIDPQVNVKNHVYGGDAYTPTAPGVEYPVNYDRMLSVEKRLNQLAMQVARGIFRNSSVIRSAGIEDRVLCDKSALSVLQWNVDSSAFPQRTMRRNDGFILLMLTAEALGYNAREYGFCTENLVKYS